jgi:hypothetical protein
MKEYLPHIGSRQKWFLPTDREPQDEQRSTDY